MTSAFSRKAGRPLPPALSSFVSDLGSLEAQAMAATFKAAAPDDLAQALDRHRRSQLAAAEVSNDGGLLTDVGHADVGDGEAVRSRGATLGLPAAPDALLSPSMGDGAGTGEEQVSGAADTFGADAAQAHLDSRVAALESQVAAMGEDMGRALKSILDLRETLATREPPAPSCDAAVQADTPRSLSGFGVMLDSTSPTASDISSQPLASFRPSTQMPKLTRNLSLPFTGQESPTMGTRSLDIRPTRRDPRSPRNAPAGLVIPSSNASVGNPSLSAASLTSNPGSTLEGREMQEITETADRLFRRLERDSSNSQQLVRRLEMQAEQWRREARATRDFRKAMSEDVQALKQRANTAQTQVEALLGKAEKGEQQRGRDDDATRKAERGLRQKVQGMEERMVQIAESSKAVLERIDEIEEAAVSQAQLYESGLNKQRATTTQMLQAQTVLVDEVTKLDETIRDVSQRLADKIARDQRREEPEQLSSTGSPATSFRSINSSNLILGVVGSRRSGGAKMASLLSPRRTLTGNVPGAMTSPGKAR